MLRNFAASEDAANMRQDSTMGANSTAVSVDEAGRGGDAQQIDVKGEVTLHEAVDADVTKAGMEEDTGEEAPGLPIPPPPPEVLPVDEWAVASDEPLAGGRLQLVPIGDERHLRVWLPPGYAMDVCPEEGHPVLVLNDGQNLFVDKLSFSGCSWRAAEAAALLIANGDLPPFVIIGIDHSGPTRSYDYCPVRPGVGEHGMRQDARDWPGGGVEQYLHVVLKSVLPWATATYNLATAAHLRAFGGSSFGGICALCMGMHAPGAFGSLIVESPSLWIDDGRFLRDTIGGYAGIWPEKIYLAMGGKEYSGVRAAHAREREFDEYLVTATRELAGALREQGVHEDDMACEIAPDATHTEAAWAHRLPSAMRSLCRDWWRPLMSLHNNADVFTMPLRPAAGKPLVVLLNVSRVSALAHGAPRLHFGFNNWSTNGDVVDMTSASGPSHASHDQWLAASVQVPEGAYDMQFVFSDAHHQAWFNCNGANFWRRVEAAGERDLQATAHRHATQLLFTWPERIRGGERATIYLNRQQSTVLCDREPVKLVYGTDGWQNVQTRDCGGSTLWRDHAQHWYSATIDVPVGATELDCAFTDGADTWENNSGSNFALPVRTAARRRIEHEAVNEHASGLMHVLTLAKPEGLSAKAARAARWTTEKTVRVWTPAGHSAGSSPPGGWPVIVFNDGQNKFEDWLAHQGVSWRVGDCASGLITTGQLPPFVAIAIDNSGPMRSLNYLPYPPGSGVGGFRGDAERWPGGGVSSYMSRVVDDILPVLSDRFGLATHPSRVAFGGGSFGGICALYAAMHYPHVFGSIIAESPSLWIAEGRFLGDLAAHQGPLPERLFLGCGTQEYSATRDHDRQDMDDLLLHYYCEAERILRSKGMDGTRFHFQVEDGAGHHEKAWAWRLSGAMLHTLSHWWGRY